MLEKYKNIKKFKTSYCEFFFVEIPPKLIPFSIFFENFYNFFSISSSPYRSKRILPVIHFVIQIWVSYKKFGFAHSGSGTITIRNESDNQLSHSLNNWFHYFSLISLLYKSYTNSFNTNK